MSNTRMEDISEKKKALLKQLLLKKKQASNQKFELLNEQDKQLLPDNIEDAFPLGVVQQGMMYHMLSTRDVNAPPDYHNVACYWFRLGHTFCVDVFQKSIDLVVANEPILRTAFDLSTYSEPLQLVYKEAKLAVVYHDLRALSEVEQSAEIEAFIEKENFNTFDTSKPSLQRYTIHHLKDNLIVYTITEPHSISDGWSTHLTIIDLFKTYLAQINGQHHPLAKIEASYQSFIKVEKHSVESKETREFWRQQLANVQVTELPLFDQEDTSQLTFGDHRELVVIPENTFANLKAIAKKVQVGLKSVLLAAHVRMLSLLSGQLKVTTGLAFNGRLEVKDGEKVRGMFLNMLPVTIDLRDGNWLDLVKRCHDAEMMIIPHRFYPLGLLQNDYGEQSLFKTVMNHLHFYTIKQEGFLQDGQFEFVKVRDLSKTNYDYNPVFMSDSLDDNKLSYIHDANLDRFSIAQLNNFTHFYLNILEDLAHRSDGEFNRIDYYTDSYRRLLVDDCNQTHNAINRVATLHGLFEAQVQRTPKKLAVYCTTTHRSLTYEMLNQQANSVAWALLNAGVSQAQHVLVAYDRSIEAVISYLAISKIGATYLPIESTIPESRVAQIIASCQPKVALADEFSDYDITSLNVASIVQQPGNVTNINLAVNPQTPLYILHTSGTTGDPKGVVISQKGVCHYLQWAVKFYDIKAQDCMPVFTQLGFDLTVTSLFSCLLVGGSIRIYPDSAVGLSMINMIADNQLTLIKLTPAHLRIIQDLDVQQCQVDRLIVGGEQLTVSLASATRQKFNQQVRIFNEYGPTESTVGCICHEYQPDKDIRGAVPIGKPIDHCKVYILDERRLPVPVGVKGQLYIAGAGLANGYFNQPEETVSCFVDNPFHGGVMYRSGDMVQRLHNGLIEYLNRQDSQLSFKGFRVEAGEVVLYIHDLDSVSQAVIDVVDLHGVEHLSCYLIPTDMEALHSKALQQQIIGKIQGLIKKNLPSYMTPTHFQFLRTLPMNRNGKLDHQALMAEPGFVSTFVTKQTAFVQPQNDIERTLLDIWQKLLKKEAVSVEDNFFDIGGNSILVFQLQAHLSANTEFKINIVDLFEYPSIRHLAAYLLKSAENETQHQPRVTTPPLSRHGTGDIAIIGMAGRFTFAPNLDVFWQQLLAGAVDLQQYSRETLIGSGVSLNELSDPSYVSQVSLMPQRDMFDADFFAMTPREAQLMDPQQRLLLETAVVALDDAGYGDASRSRSVGVYVGTGESAYFLKNLNSDPVMVKENSAQIQFGNSRDFSATQIAYKLNLRGPAYTVSAACSTGLVAVHQACEALQNGLCEMALAGGAKIGRLSPSGYLYQEGGILSPDGQCRAFDRQANGTRAGEGVGLLIMKSLERAIEDGDRIDAVIKGIGINNDGDEKIGFTAPSIQGQTAVIEMALAQAQLQAQQIDFIETHGTGTALGDQIELQALNKVFANTSANKGADKIRLGTLKANIGHLDVAAGIASLIKTVLVLKHRRVPPNANLIQPCAVLTEADPPFAVTQSTVALAASKSLHESCYAGVSSFGIGGTNVHVVLSDYLDKTIASESHAAEQQLLVLSANSPAALAQMQIELVEKVNTADYTLEDVAFTLNQGRTSRRYRSFCVADATFNEQSPWMTEQVSSSKPVTVFMFPGQGSQMAGIGRELIQRSPIFSEYLERCIAQIQSSQGIDLKPMLVADDQQTVHTLLSDDLVMTQLFVFSMSWSYAKILGDFGIKPDLMIGHSVGEYVAAVLAEVMSVEDAIDILAARGRLMQQMSQGRMLSIRASLDKFNSLCQDLPVEIAAENSPTSLVVSLAVADEDQVVAYLKQHHLAYKVLDTTRAFHSSHVDGICRAFEAFLDRYEFQSPSIPYASNVTGDLLTEKSSIDSQYWVAHMRQRVQFDQGIEQIATYIGQRPTTYIELGSGVTLATLIKQKLSKQLESRVISMSAHPHQDISQVAYFFQQLGSLWGFGHEPNLALLYTNSKPNRVGLPGYPFERQVHWFEAKQSQQQVNSAFYRTIWAAVPIDTSFTESLKEQHWYIVNYDQTFTAGLDEQLQQHGVQTTKVIWDPPVLDQPYSADIALYDSPTSIGSCFFDELIADQSHRIRLLYPLNQAMDETAVMGGFALLKDAASLTTRVFIEVVFVTCQGVSVLGQEDLDVYAAGLMAFANVARQECQHLDVRVIDVDEWINSGSGVINALQKPERLLAYRHQLRWSPDHKMINLQPSPPVHQWKTTGTYVITGGLGQIGLFIAEFLATVYQAHVILLGRNTLPDPQEWTEYINNSDPHSRIHQQLKTMQRIGETSGRVTTMSVDISHSSYVKQTFELIKAENASIDGVIHCAGKVTDSHRMLSQTNDDYIQSHIRGKFYGLMMIDQHLEILDPEFVLVMSSLSVVLGGLGFAAYSYANALADAYVQRKHNQGDQRWIVVDWDGWSLTAAQNATGGIQREEGMQALTEALALSHNAPLIYARSDLEQSCQKWLHIDNYQAFIQLHQQQNVRSQAGSVDNVAQILINEWQRLLGIEQIDLKQDFFMLGGDSLLVGRVIAFVRQMFGVSKEELNFKAFFNEPTIEFLHRVIQSSAQSSALHHTLGEFALTANEQYEEGEL